MRKEKGSGFYDRVFQEERWSRPFYQSEYFPLWSHLVSLFPKDGLVEMIDLGCGPGQFASFIRACGLSKSYKGIDFSVEAIRLARERCPEMRFHLCDAYDVDNWPRFGAVIACEFLEHVDDLLILGAIPRETPIYFTLPSFHAESHLRHFESEDEIRLRYGGSELADLEVYRCGIFFYGKGVRR
jgi:SAM-dependent methyltransferase